ncbi:uncharacterized protein DS421_19g663060 [Arachis hypogaea]|uniref:Uncharacterized protein n=1 Tax=Arachis hypogaea TaxID=3818 RepID=A0A6B9V9Y7_ARAHY|nr:uncharacterized protein DS421_19g663060 [Arachis hypogaea]QHN78637.1 uncharacterized protein DS421_19g663060 [Arachis hypogaea]
MDLNDYGNDYLDPRFRRHPKKRGRWYRIQWRKRLLSPPKALKRLILLDKRPRCYHITSIKCRTRMNIHMVECPLIRRMRGT